MILSDILEDIDTILPNPYSEEEKVTFLNKTIKEISKCAGKCDMFLFRANEHLRLYPLPYYIKGGDIITVSRNGEVLKALDQRDCGDGYYLVADSFIGFTERPKSNSRIMIVFQGLTPFLKLGEVLLLGLEEEDFKKQEIRLDEEHRYLLLYGAMADMAAGMEDTGLSNNLRAEFNALKAQALQSRYKKRGRYPKTAVVT